METPLALLKFLAKASLNAVGGGVAGDLVVDVMPGVFRDVWGKWSLNRSEQERRAELEAIAGTPSDQFKKAAKEVAAETAAGKPVEVALRLESYLNMVPGSLRKSLRRPTDPRGVTLPLSHPLQKPEDLGQLLPQRPPRFFPGQRPLANVDWQVVKLLGCGGFGEVWLARNPQFDNMPKVALKFCLDPAAKQTLLEHEAKVLNQVMHRGRDLQGIVRLRQTYLSADPPCLEYEYVSGGDLADLVFRMKEHGRKLEPSAANKILLRLAKTMGQAHQLNPPIVHRDLKPANILVENREDGRLSLRIADFGIGGIAAGRALEQTRRSTGPVLLSTLQGSHTPLYASPQQQAGEPPDPGDDVHALGVIWYQLLAGDLAKGAPTGKGWRTGLLQQGVDTATLDLMEECFEGDAAHRIKDGVVLAERLDALLTRQVPQVGPGVAVSDPGGTDSTPEQVSVKKPEETDSESGPGDRTVTPPDRLAEGAAYLEGRQYSLAVKAFTRALKIDAKCVEGYRQRARAYLGLGKHDKALADLDRLVRNESKVAANLAERGRLHAARGNHDKAISDFTQAVQLGDRSAPIYLDRGRSYAAKGWFDHAFTDFESALRQDPLAAEVYFERGEARRRQGTSEQALADFDEAARLRPEDARFINARGKVFLQLGKTEEAKAEFNRAIHTDPGAAEGYLNRAAVLASRGGLEQALADLNHAVSADRDSAEAFAARGKVRARLGQHSWAVSDFTRALESRPRDVSLHLERGRSQQEKGELKAAIKDFQAAIRYSGGSAEASEARGLAYLASEKFGFAAQDFTDALRLEPARVASLAGLARANVERGQHDLAIEGADAALRIDPSCPAAHWVRGRAHLAKGALDQALADLTQAILLNSQEAEWFSDRGRTHHLRENHDLAIADFTAAIRLDSKVPAYYQNRARAYAKKGDGVKAQLDRERARALSPAPRSKEQPPAEQPIQVPGPSTEEQLPGRESGIEPLPLAGEDQRTAVPVPRLVPGKPYWNSLGNLLLPVPEGFLPDLPPLDSFVAVACVSNGDYLAFVQEGGPEPRTSLAKAMYRSWQGKHCPESILDHPVLQVAQEDARLFCEWLTTKERSADRLGPNYEYRLPTFDQWKAWVKGSKLQEVTVTDRDWREGEQQPTLPVASGGASPLGLYHDFGNVFEWCADEFEEDGIRYVQAVGGGWASTRDWLAREIRKKTYGGIWRKHGLPMKDGGFRLTLCRC